MVSQIPMLKDFSSHVILYPDEKYAIEHFLGKTLNEAKKLFKENDIYYADDLRWMGMKAFQFYLPAYTDFITSNDSNVSSDTLNNFVSLLKSKLKDGVDSIKPCKELLLETLEYCIQNYSKFDIDTKIYGNLKSEVSEILEKIKKDMGSNLDF